MNRTMIDLKWKKESIIGFDREFLNLQAWHAELKQRPPFNFSGLCIGEVRSGDNREVFVDSGDGWLHGLVPSYIHLQEKVELMYEALFWRLEVREMSRRRDGWFKRLLFHPWKVW